MQFNEVRAPRFSLQGSERINNVSRGYSEFGSIPQLRSWQKHTGDVADQNSLVSVGPAAFARGLNSQQYLHHVSL